MNTFYNYFKNQFLFRFNSWDFFSIVTSLIIFIPIFIIITNFNAESENWSHIKENLLFDYISSTLFLVVGVGLTSTIIGVGCAWFVSCYEFYGRKFIEWILILPMTIPTYVAAFSYYDTLENFNYFFIWCRNHIGLNQTMKIENTIVYLVVIILFSFVLYPYVFLSVRASLMIQGRRTIEAANTLGIPTNKLLRKVIIPIIRPAIIAGVSLVVMETLNDYAAVEYFGISTLTVGIFRSWFGMYDVESALKLSSYLIMLVFLILVLEKMYRKGARYNNDGGKSNLRRIIIGNKKQYFIIIFCLTPFIFGFLIPVIRLFTWMLTSHVNIYELNLIKTVFNTFYISIISSFTIVFLAYFINFSKNYFNNDACKKISQLAILGYSMPGAIIAIGILKFGSAINDLVSIVFIGSIFGLIFSYIVRFFAVAWQPIDSSMEKFCKNVNQASRTLNVKPLKLMKNINFPILSKPIMIAGLIVFIDISKELPLTLIIRPFNFDTLATLTYDLVNQAQFFQSAIPSLLIILISIPAILIIKTQMDESI